VNLSNAFLVHFPNFFSSFSLLYFSGTNYYCTIVHFRFHIRFISIHKLLYFNFFSASSNLAKIQRYQAKTLRQITNAPWYVTNHTLHKDLNIPQVRTVLQQQIATHRTALQSRPNPLMAHVLNQPDSRRLQRRWTLDENT